MIDCRASFIMAAWAATFVAAAPPATRPAMVLEAEAAEPHGTLVATTRPGYSGTGYVTGFHDKDDALTFRVDAAAGGLYAADVRYSASSSKGYGLAVNGVERSDQLPATGDAFAVHAAGKLELRPGANTIVWKKGWGHYDLDRIELFPTELRPMTKPPPTLVNPDATPAARDLMRRLVDGYGDVTLSGVYGATDAQTVFDRVGVRPAVMGADLMDYSPSRVERGAKARDTPERMIRDAAAGYVMTVCWHWNAPTDLIDKEKIVVDGKTMSALWHSGFYTRATTFDVAKALDDPAGANYALLLRDIDAIAVQLKKLDAAGVPVLWRPLHEADGGWFWWGAKGPDAFKRLWALLYDRLTRVHKLNNLIWVYTGSEKWDWYPPADQFDVIGVDLYPEDMRDPGSAIWDALQARYGRTKLLTLSEFGGVARHRSDGPARRAVGVLQFLDRPQRSGCPVARTAGGVVPSADDAQPPDHVAGHAVEAVIRIGLKPYAPGRAG